MGKKRILILGGDKRQYYMAKFLVSENFAISYFGTLFENDQENIQKIRTFQKLFDEAEKDCFDYVYLPIPCNKDILKGTDGKVTLEAAEQLLKKCQKATIIGGCILDSFAQKVGRERIYDVMRDETIAILNGQLTAENAILEAVLLSDMAIVQSEVLVIGYGRCGRMLADTLKGLKAHVTVAEPNQEKAALAISYGYRIEPLLDLQKYQFIFQTAPKEGVLDNKLLSTCLLGDAQKEVVILDIASVENSIDNEYADRNHIMVKKCPGLPGKYTAKSAGKLLAEYLLRLDSKDMQ